MVRNLWQSIAVAGVLVVMLTALAIPSAATLYSAPAVVQTASLQNPGFEGGMGSSQVYWTPDGGPYYPGVDPGNPRRGNIRPPEGWTAWWRDGFDCDLAYTFKMGQPEMLVAEASLDPFRIFEGNRAVKAFTFFRCHDMGILQTTSAVSGVTYYVEAMAHAWYTSCSSKPFDPPYENDCSTRIYGAHDYLSVGIDPEGGIDPLGADVVWGQEVEIYGQYDGVITVTAKAQADQITVFLRSRADTPLKHNDVYWDSVVLSVHLALQVEPATLVLLAEEGGADPEPQPIAVDSSSFPFSWMATVSPTASWLAVSALSGTTPSVVTATVSTSGLSIGQYTTGITIESGDALSGSPQTVPVTLVVAEEIYKVFLPLTLSDD